jgi:hypothetical protein
MKGAAFFSTNKSQDIVNVRFTGTTFNFTHYFADDGTIKRALVGISGDPTSYSGVTRSGGGTGTTRPYSITGLTAGEKVAQIKTYRKNQIGYTSFGGGLIGGLDFSDWSEQETLFSIVSAPGLTAITSPTTWKGVTNSSYTMFQYTVVNTGIKDLDISIFQRYQDLDIYDNQSLTAITFPVNVTNLGRFHNLDNNNLTGNLDLTNLDRLQNRYTFIFNSNPNLTGVTFPSVPANKNFASLANPLIYGYNCNIQGNLDLSPLSGFPTYISFAYNSISGITFPSYSAISSGPNNIVLSGCGLMAFNNNNLTGNLDLSIFKKMYNVLELQDNLLLTGVTFDMTGTSNDFNEFKIFNCNLTGNLDLSTVSGVLGGSFSVANNPNLTGITFSSSGNTHYSTGPSTSYMFFNDCDLTGNLNMSGITGLSTSFYVIGNNNLTGVTHGPSVNPITAYLAQGVNLQGTHDMSKLTGLGGRVSLYLNTGMTNVLLPVSVETFSNGGTGLPTSAIGFYGCNLGYVDFKPLSGATLSDGVRIRLQNNNMIADEVNQILVDFSGNATYNLIGWDNIDLDIGGTNADPDSSSGGYNGLAAVSFLTGSPQNWTITY